MALSETDLLGDMERSRAGRSFRAFFLIAGIVLLVVEGLFADRLLKGASPTKELATARAEYV